MSATVNYTNIDPTAGDGEILATITASQPMMSLWLLDDYGGALAIEWVTPMTYNIVVVDSSALPSAIELKTEGTSVTFDGVDDPGINITYEGSFDANPDITDTQINEAVTADVLDNDNGASDATVISVSVDPAQGTAVIEADGRVTFTPAQDFLGDAVVTYTIKNAAGETSTSTLTVTVSDTVAPTQTVTITSITDDVDPVMGDLGNGSTTNDTAPILNGTLSEVLDSNEVVAIYKDGVKVGEATVNGTTWTYADSGLANGEDYTYTARVEDSAGNVGGLSDDFTITIDTTAPSFTATNGVEITTDTNNDGFINAAEVGADIAVKFNILQAQAGDIITAADNFGHTQDITLTATDIANGYVTTTFPNPPEGATITVIATISDPAGNTSAPATDSAKLDTSDLTTNGGISVRVVDDADDNGLISATELGTDGKITVEVTLQENVAAGDKLILTATGNSDVEITLTQAQIDAKTVTVDFNAPSNGVNFVTTAQVTDPALNKSNLAEDSATLKLDAPGAPMVVITEDVNNDGYINANELNGQVDVSVKAPAGTAIGSTLIISDNAGHTQNVTVTQDVIDNGTTVGFPAPAEGETITVKAVVEDLAGNQSSEGTDSATIDTTSPALSPTNGVEIKTDADNDGYIDASEKSSSVLVQVNIDKAEVGDVVTVKDNAGHSTPITLTAADIANGYVTTTFPNPAEGATIIVTATIADKAGNVSAPATDSAKLDTNIPSFTATNAVEIKTDANNDGFINASEKGSEVLVQINIEKAEVGDIITVSDNAGNSTPITLTATDIANKYVTTTFPNPPEGATITVIATISDPAGNTSAPATDSAKLDTSDLTTNGGISVRVVDDADDNGLISATELGTDGKITVEVTLQENVAAGDKLILTATGNSDVEITLTQAQIDAKTVTVDFNAPSNGVNFVTTAQVTDPALNKSNLAEDSATLKLDAPGAPMVVITEDVNNDGYINANELNGQVDVSVKAPAGTAIGSTLIISDNAGHTQNVTVTQDVIDNGTTVGFPAPAEGETITVKAVVEDLAGNQSSEGTDSATIDTTSPALSPTNGVEIKTDADNDGYIDASEKSSSVLVQVNIDKAEVGDVVTVKDNAGHSTPITLTAADIANGYVTTTFPNPAEGATITVIATIADKAGNVSAPATDSATLDATAPDAPTVSIIEDVNNDGFINASEIGTQVDVSVTAPAGTAIGSTLIISDNAGNTQNVLVTQDVIDNGTIVSFPNPAEGATIIVKAVVQDLAGNQSSEGTDSAKLDTSDLTTNGGISVRVVDDADDNGLISATELGTDGKITVE
ncbi:MAG: Ig-like domain-containing protein, partial [Sulfurovaceae bacterium]|nr:Ig-like domain-containing protein [Sulfurovaceae bacterium]